MALGAVQSGYTGAAYAYRRTSSATGKFYSEISSAAQMAEDGCKNSKVDLVRPEAGGFFFILLA